MDLALKAQSPITRSEAGIRKVGIMLPPTALRTRTVIVPIVVC